MRGRKPELKAVDGGLLNAPPMPETLPAEMAEEWAVIAADLTGRGLLPQSALGILETYVGALFTARQCRKAMAEYGPLTRSKEGALRPNPAAAILSKANETISRLGYEMGLSAAGRNHPNIKKQTGAPDDDDSAALGL